MRRWDEHDPGMGTRGRTARGVDWTRRRLANWPRAVAGTAGAATLVGVVAGAAAAWSGPVASVVAVSATTVLLAGAHAWFHGAPACRAERPRPSSGDRVVRPDGGRNESPRSSDADGTDFVWGPARSDDHSAEETRGSGEDDGGDGGDGRTVHDRLDAIEGELEALDDLADHLEMLAMNCQLKIAREQPDELESIAYDVEADAQALERATRDVGAQVAHLREQLAPGAGESHTGRQPASGTGSDPLSDISAPESIAGVDLSQWPGHLRPFDFERARRAVRTSVGPDPGDIPSVATEFELSEDEIPFEVLLTFADYFGSNGSDRGDDSTGESSDTGSRNS